MADEAKKPWDWLNAYEIGHPKKRAFLAAFALFGTISRASEAAEISRANHYNWLKDDDGEIYAKAFEDAKQRACDALEQEARRRAMEGVEKPIVRNGFVVDTYTEYSDTLLIFLMKGAMPDKYKDRIHQEHTVTEPNLGDILDAVKKKRDGSSGS
jgi:hypothetical protein